MEKGWTWISHSYGKDRKLNPWLALACLIHKDKSRVEQRSKPERQNFGTYRRKYRGWHLWPHNKQQFLKQEKMYTLYHPMNRNIDNASL